MDDYLNCDRDRMENNNYEDDKNTTTSTILVEDESDQLKDNLEITFDDYNSILSSFITIYEGQDEKPKIPDGGWGWMVVFSSLLISAIIDGVSFSFGLLYIEFLDEFHASKSTTAWIGSLFLAVPLLTGPIMSALVDKYGCKNMTIIGGLVSGLGFVLSAFVDNIGMMLLTFGVLSGLGLGVCYVTAVVSIAYWFDKKRTLAVGLGACGTGVGTFVCAPLTQFLIGVYGWRSTTLLLAGLFLNICVCGCLLRDPDWWMKEQIKNQTSKSSKKTTSTATLSSNSVPDNFPDMDEIRKILKSSGKNEYLLQSLIATMESLENVQNREHHRSDFDLPTYIKQNEKVPIEVLEQLKDNKKLYNVILENYPSILMCRSVSDKGLNKITDSVFSRVPVTLSLKLKKTKPVDKSVCLIDNQQNEKILQKSIINRQSSLDEKLSHIAELPCLKKPTFANTNYYNNIRLHRNSIVYRGAMLNIKKYRLRASSCPNIYKNSMTTLAKESTDNWYDELVDLLKGMTDFSLFLEFHFLLMSLSTILLFIWYIVPYFYLAEHMTRLGYTESEASLALAVIGVTNMIATVALGWAGDQPWMHIIKTYSVCLIGCGISCAGMFVCSPYYIPLLVSAGAFGLFFASSFSFTPVILVELVPLERFTTAYGLILLCQGIGSLLGPPVAGLLFDFTQSWDQSFYQAGFWMVVSGILVAVIPYTKNRKIFGSGPVEKELIATTEKSSEA